jgi:hypothetical protein
MSRTPTVPGSWASAIIRSSRPARLGSTSGNHHVMIVETSKCPDLPRCSALVAGLVVTRRVWLLEMCVVVDLIVGPALVVSVLVN